MKKSIFSFFLVVLTMQALAWTSPVNIPDVGNARLRIAGQNAQNYLMDLTASNSSCATEEEFKEKLEELNKHHEKKKKELYEEYGMEYLSDEE